MLTGALAALAWLAVASLPNGRLHVAFLDVGQGEPCSA
jgi:beta-lactamase superfamily II metal-dependent hydrolase